LADKAPVRAIRGADKRGSAPPDLSACSDQLGCCTLLQRSR